MALIWDDLPKFSAELKKGYGPNKVGPGVLNKFELEDVATFFDVPAEILKEISNDISFPKINAVLGGDNLRVQTEYFIYKKGFIPLKWIAIKYGITSKSLLNLLRFLVDNSSSIFKKDEFLMMTAKDARIVEHHKVKNLIDNFLQSEEATIFTSHGDMARHLHYLCEKNKISCELVADANYYWLQEARQYLKLPSLKSKPAIASTFCVYTGLPVAHWYTEYTTIYRKPSILDADQISWLAILENRDLQEYCSFYDRTRFNNFITKLLMPSKNE